MEAGIRVDTLSLFSERLQEERTVILIRSADFTEDVPASFLYLTDGESSLSKYRSLMQESGQENKNMVGVGIINTDRRRDLLQAFGAENFLAFISGELIPVVENGYDVRERILFGHSFGGSFVVYALISRPGLFNRYIASSPVPLQPFMDETIYSRLDHELDKPVLFCMSCGSRDMKQVRKWTGRLNERLSALPFINLVYRFSVFEGRDHSSSALPALIRGMEIRK